MSNFYQLYEFFIFKQKTPKPLDLELITSNFINSYLKKSDELILKNTKNWEGEYIYFDFVF